MKPTAVRGWLLDTHTLLWMLYGDKRLKAGARRVINGPQPLHYSTVSFWEIALKRAAKGFDFEIEEDWDILLPAELQRLGVLRIDLEAPDCRAAGELEFHHRDPFDRMLVAQAIKRRIGIVSKDTAFDSYPVLRIW
jgi:PIN domain nuclease of toxin-antitoxin system